MQEYSSELLVDPSGKYRNITDLLEKRAQQAPDHVAFEIPSRNGAGKISGWEPISTQEFRARVRALAKGFIAAGLQAGDTLAVLSPTRFEWALVDNAAMYAGALVVPIYDSSSPAQIQAIIQDADIRWALAGSAKLARKLDTALEGVHPQGLYSLWCMDSETGYPSLQDLAQAGQEVSDEVLEERRTLADLDDPATLVYTSGTTGTPKGAVITHRNFVGQVLNVAAAYTQVVEENGRTIIFLPLAHVLARGLQMICLSQGMRIAHLSDPGELIGQLGEVRPTFLVVVPRVLEKIRDAVGSKARSARLGWLWRAAVGTAVRYGAFCEKQDEGASGPIPQLLKLQVAFYDRLFYSKIRSLMGGQTRWLLSGGAPLDRELSLLFRGMGLPVIEGYGLTETTAPLCGNLPGFIRSGTVGVPLPGVTVRISESGQVLARGIGVFAGYRGMNRQESGFDAEGFFATGDSGTLDEQGRLRLTGRIKDDLVTSSGKSVSPYTWEAAMEKNPLVAHAVMVGEGRNYLTALLVADPEHAAGMNSTELETRMEALIQQANGLISRAEQVKNFSLVSVDPNDSELITPTQKLKRTAFVSRWAEVIEEMYR